jgi:hypothetical protein
LLINHIETGTTVIEEAYMTEIQLRRIIDRTSSDTGDQQSDGDERITKDGKDISKFSKEAMNIDEDALEHEVVLRKVYLVYDKWVGNDSVFPLTNGAPKIMTKFKDKPYSYELLPEYLHGEKKFPCVKAMNWEGKTATCSVIRGFVKATPVVERCSLQPLCISRLIIAPKFAPGQEKSDPDHGFRVCVNALVNKCLKPYGSTIPLARCRWDQKASWIQVLSRFRWVQRLLEHTRVRREQEAHSFSHPRRHLLLESTDDGGHT